MNSVGWIQGECESSSHLLVWQDLEFPEMNIQLCLWGIYSLHPLSGKTAPLWVASSLHTSWAEERKEPQKALVAPSGSGCLHFPDMRYSTLNSRVE